MKAKIVYEGELNSRLDTLLISAMETHGWHFWAAGYDLEANERDMAFDREPAPWLDESGHSDGTGTG